MATFLAKSKMRRTSHPRKPIEAQENEIVAGLLWSDPVQKLGTSNSSRGIGIFFGPDITKRFLGVYLFKEGWSQSHFVSE